MDRYVKLKECVGVFLSQHSKSIRDFDKCWLLAFRALRDLNQSVAAEPKSVRLPVSGNKTVPLPADYTAWSKIGVLNDIGEVVSLGINNALSIFSDDMADRMNKVSGSATSSSIIVPQGLYFNYCDDGVMYNLYGVAGGLQTAGQCRVDEKNNIIILNEDFQYPDIILEYISTPERDGDYYIQGCLQEAVIAFIEWKLKLGTEQAYYAAVINGRRSLQNNRVTLQRIHEVLRETGGQYLKA